MHGHGNQFADDFLSEFVRSRLGYRHAFVILARTQVHTREFPRTDLDWKIFDTRLRPSLTLSKMLNSSCVIATNRQLSVNTSECNGVPDTWEPGSGRPVQTEFNGLPVVFSPINVNYNGKCFVHTR